MNTQQIRQFRTVLRKLERDVAIRQKRNDRTGGLSVVQCHTVINLGETGEVTIGEMAERMGVDKSTLSRTMDGLVSRQLVSRIPHPKDRRYTLVRLTPRGRKICDQLNDVNDTYIQRVFSRIDPSQHNTILSSLADFVKAMNEENRVNE